MEVRRRLKVMGYSQNTTSSDRIIYAILDYINSKWQQPTRGIKIIYQLGIKQHDQDGYTLFRSILDITPLGPVYLQAQALRISYCTVRCGGSCVE